MTQYGWPLPDAMAQRFQQFRAEGGTPAVPRRAATVVLVRPGPDGQRVSHPPRFGRAAPTALLCLGLIIAGLAMSACDKEKGDASGSAKSSASGAVIDTAQPLCALSNVRCSSVSTAEEIAEYAVISASSGPAEGTVLLELGGPGVDLFARSDTGSFGLPKVLERFDLIVMREPWAATSQQPMCKRALREMAVALSRGEAGPVVLGPRKCSYISWRRTSYLAALNKALQSEKRTLAGIVGQSYGALPASEAARLHPTAWLLLHAPIAPPSTTATGLVDGRDAALVGVLNASYASSCRKLKADCRRSGAQVATGAINQFAEVRVGGRSAPLRRGDLELAIMAAAYDLEANETWLWRVLGSVKRLEQSDLRSVGRLADQLIQRFGQGDVSIRLGAYMAGLCSSFAGWTKVTEDVPERSLLMRAVIDQCGQSESAASGWSTRMALGDRRVCVVINEMDPVAPVASARGWATVFPGATVVQYRYRGHTSLGRSADYVKAAGRCVPL